ncbi:DoxX family protein [Paenibacillus aquistagni]|uniref:Putative oxidoreductase n=1 Tax=Paenibacillus aquistagni TaxID=1852522 RepID=A0A1X7L939_9BACL|nr:DoxX family protein [Paenibacillus aquistagni]SMG50341.1 putative oxidoreductase [Paenibacillus aquistagni]
MFSDFGVMDYGLLVIRLVLGLSMMAHGAQKLFGMFGGYGLKGTGGWMESLGLKPGIFMALMAGLGEFVGGLLLAVGLFTWAGGILVAGTMLVAILTAHLKNGYWSTQNGYEYNLLIIAVAIGLALTGAGAVSIDALIG